MSPLMILFLLSAYALSNNSLASQYLFLFLNRDNDCTSTSEEILYESKYFCDKYILNKIKEKLL